MSKEKADRNRRIALDFYARALSIRTIARACRKDPSTVQRIVDRYRKTLSPEALEHAEANRKKLLLRYRYGKKKR